MKVGWTVYFITAYQSTNAFIWCVLLANLTLIISKVYRTWCEVLEKQPNNILCYSIVAFYLTSVVFEICVLINNSSLFVMMVFVLSLNFMYREFRDRKKRAIAPLPLQEIKVCHVCEEGCKVCPCVICLESMEACCIYSMEKCKHQFHEKCVKEWFRVKLTESCPLCRRV